MRPHQVIRPGCTVGIIADGSQLGDRSSVVEKFLQLDLHDKLVYASGEKAKNKQVSFQIQSNTFLYKCAEKNSLMFVYCHWDFFEIILLSGN